MMLALTLTLGASTAFAQDANVAAGVIVGELRTFAIDPDNQQAVEVLHRAGWLEADGRVLKRADFPELHTIVGEAWTSKKVAPDSFGVPDLRDRRHTDPNPYGVLGPGDLLNGGAPTRPLPRPRTFIYAGRDVRVLAAGSQSPRR